MDKLTDRVTPCTLRLQPGAFVEIPAALRDAPAVARRVLLTLAALLVTPAHAGVTAPSPYRLSIAGAEQQLYQLTPRQAAARPVSAEPDDSRPYARQIARAAMETGLDPELVHAVIAVESAYRANAVSPKGAVGLMQVLPETARSHGVRNVVDVRENLRAGTRHLSLLMQRFDRRLDLVLAAYNAGEGAVRRYDNRVPPFAETRSYVPAVVARYRANSRGASGEMPAPATVPSYLPGTRLQTASLDAPR